MVTARIRHERKLALQVVLTSSGPDPPISSASQFSHDKCTVDAEPPATRALPLCQGVHVTLRMRLLCEIFRSGASQPEQAYEVLNEVVLDPRR